MLFIDTCLSSSSFLTGWVLDNYKCVCFTTQYFLSKICRYKEKKWDSKRMLSSGGMPSSHSAGVTALAVAIGLQEGTNGSAFALAVVLACIVCTS